MKKITALSLYIINKVRFERLIIGMSARYLSVLLEHTEAYVSNIESQQNENQYPPHEYPKLAKELNCTVHDLLPPNQTNSTGELVDKVVLNLSNKADLKMVIEGLIAYGFFDRPKSIEDITKHLEMKNEDQIDLLVSAMADAVENGSLKQCVLEYYRDIV